MLVQNINPVNPISRAEDVKTILPAADQKTQHVSKGFFKSLGNFALKLLKTVVIVATFPVSLPLMYLSSKFKNSEKEASLNAIEHHAEQKPSKELSGVASSTNKTSAKEVIEADVKEEASKDDLLKFYRNLAKGFCLGASLLVLAGNKPAISKIHNATELLVECLAAHFLVEQVYNKLGLFRN